MDTQPNKAKLFSKMAQVMQSVRLLEKTGRNTFDKYDYVTADAIATRVGAEMSSRGLALFPSIVGVETSDYATKNGGNNFRTVVHMQITVACGESGATWTSDWYGEAIDRSDKSISKAAVSAVKYYLLKTFLLAGGDEEDADSQSPTVEAKPAQATQKPATAQKQASGQDATRSHESPPHARLWGQGQSALGNDWDMARPWLISKWTSKVTPDNTRNSASELGDDEKDMLADYIKDNLSALQGIWRKQKASMLQSNGVAA